ESASYFIFQLIAAGMSYDEVYFDKIFSHCLIRFGLKDTYLQVIYPTMARIGLMWTRGVLPPAQEHFLSNLFRQKLFTAIDALPPAKSDANSWLLFLPENEFHEIGLLFAHYLISLAGHQVIYLGSNVPYKSFSELEKEISVNNILLFLVHNYSDEEVTQLLNEIITQFSGKRIFVACQQHISNHIVLQGEINWLTSVMDLEQIL
ncbi:MAG: B12-binding domain-containing protein, partial [Ginsengibacter sp.]